MLSSQNIRAWLESEPRSGLDAAPCDDALARARDVWRCLKRGVEVHNLIEAIVSVGFDPDVAFAISDLALADNELEETQLVSLTELWRWFAGAAWSPNEFDEQRRFLATFSFAIAQGFGRLHAYRPMVAWEHRCSTLLGGVEPERSYLAAFSAGTSRTADERVLDDPALLLTFCKQQEELRNLDPGRSLRSASRAFHLVRQRLADGSPAVLGYFAARLAASATISASHFKYHDSAAGWMQAFEFCLETTPNCEWLYPLARGMRISLLFSANDVCTVLRETPAVIRDLEELGADLQAMSVRIVEGQALKALGHYDESISVLEDLTERYANVDSLRLGVAYVHLADARLEKGDIAGAIRDCERAYPLLRDSNSILALPTLQSVVGQLFRVMGQPGAAVSALRESAANYRASDLVSWAAYAQILCAETLLLAEKPAEALEDLVTALTLLRGSEAEPELWAAVKLLRTAMMAAGPTAQQLTRCRERLKRILNGHF